MDLAIKHNELGFYLNANSSNYEEEHDEIMEYFTETLSDKLDRLFDLKYSQGNLQDILAIYEKLVDFIKNEHRISGYIFDEMNLHELFSEAVPKFDYFGPNAVTKEQWQTLFKLAHECGGAKEEVVLELKSWVEKCFEEYEVFTICGI